MFPCNNDIAFCSVYPDKLQQVYKPVANVLHTVKSMSAPYKAHLESFKINRDVSFPGTTILESSFESFTLYLMT